jgi:hypothetical protein
LDEDASEPGRSDGAVYSRLAASKIVTNCEFVAGDFPQVVSLSTGGYAIAWEMSDGSIYVLQVDAAGNVSDSRIGQGSGARVVLESLDAGDSTAIVSYGLYADDGTVVGGDTANVVRQLRHGDRAHSCR